MERVIYFKDVHGRFLPDHLSELREIEAYTAGYDSEKPSEVPYKMLQEDRLHHLFYYGFAVKTETKQDPSCLKTQDGLRFYSKPLRPIERFDQFGRDFSEPTTVELATSHVGKRRRGYIPTWASKNYSDEIGEKPLDSAERISP